MVADHQLSKLLVIIMVISLAVQTTQSEPSMTNNNTPGEDDQLLALLAVDPEPGSESLAPQYFASSPSLTAENNASPPAYNEAFAPVLFGDGFLSPQYPSPAPEITDHRELSPQDSSSPSPYVDVTAPEIADDDDKFYSPAAPTPTPATTADSPSSSSQFPNYAPIAAAPDIGYGNVDAPTPLSNVFPFTYEAEDEFLEFDEEELQGEFSHKNKGKLLGAVFFAVCLVGLGGFVFKKKKDDKRKSQYKYVCKRELEL